MWMINLDQKYLTNLCRDKKWGIEILMIVTITTYLIYNHYKCIETENNIILDFHWRLQSIRIAWELKYYINWNGSKNPENKT